MITMNLEENYRSKDREVKKKREKKKKRQTKIGLGLGRESKECGTDGQNEN